MFFLHPMWNSESERLGKKACTPLGFALHIAADWIGFLGLLSLLALLGSLVFFADRFTASLGWLLLIPFGLGVLGQILYAVSWRLADAKGFEYDPQTMTARWIENGQNKTFRYLP